MENNRYPVRLLFRLMKLSFYQLLIACLFAGLVAARPSEAQDVLNRPVTIQASNLELKTILSQIHQQANVRFTYSPTLISVGRRVSYAATNQRLAEVMDALLKPFDIGYRVDGKRVVLFKLEKTASQPEPANQAISPVKDQIVDITIKGRVTSETGEGLPGVNVSLKGANRGTTTDEVGNYVLNVPEAGATLIFSFIGYLTREEVIGNRSVINISLSADNKTLNEVVVTGYTAQAKRDITGAVVSIKSEELLQTPATNFAQQLQGRAAGVQVTNDNAPGGQVAVRIRGIGSITGGNNPLYVIDGVPTQGGLNQLNPNDIENIQILKDASSSSIYGSRANNGVVIVTTRKGKLGEAQINFDAYYGMQSPRPNPLGVLSPQQFADITWQALRNSGAVDPVTGNPVSAIFGTGKNPVIPDYLSPTAGKEGDPYTTLDSYSNNPRESGYGTTKFQITKVDKAGTDWYKALTRSAPIQSYNLSATGGSEKGRYAISAGYFDQQGIIKFTGFKRYSLRVNTEFNVKNHIKVGENFQVGYSDDVSTPGGGSVFVSANRIPSLQPVFDIAGNYSGNRDSKTIAGESNPYASLERNKDNHNYNARAFGNLYLEVNFLKNFTARSSIGVDYSSANSSAFSPYPYDNYLSNPQQATLRVSNGNNLGLTWTNTINYTTVIAGKHNITILGGTEAVTNKNTNFTTQKQGFAFENLDFRTLDAGSSISSVNGGFGASSLASIFGKAEYAYDQRFLLTATIRRDGSSRFAKNFRYGIFPAFSAGWRLSNEKFMKSLTYINDLKVRASWGQTGNQDINAYNQYSTYASANGVSYYDITGSGNAPRPGFEKRVIGNENAQWEAQSMANLGLDATLFANKINFSIDVYKRNVDKLLLIPPVLATNGQNVNGAQNVGSVYNKGIDVSLAYNGSALNGDLKFSIGGVWSTYKNEVTRLYEGQDAFITGYRTERTAELTRTAVGHPISSFYGYQLEGIFQTQEDADAHATQGGNRALFNQVGRFKFADTNGDGLVDSKDQTFIGNPIPDFTYGININATYKNFDLTVFLQGVHGNSVYNLTKYYTDFFTEKSVGVRMLDSWTPENKGAKLPKLNPNASGYESQVSSYYVEDGSYFRGKNIQVGYSLPKTLLSRISVNRLRMYAQAVNFFTKTKYSGIDPEVNIPYDQGEREVGVDRGIYPSAKSFIFGIQIGL